MRNKDMGRNKEIYRKLSSIEREILSRRFNIIPFLTLKYLSDKQEQCEDKTVFYEKYGFTFRDYELCSNISEEYQNDNKNCISNFGSSINALRNSSNKYIKEVYGNISEDVLTEENLKLIIQYLSVNTRSLLDSYYILTRIRTYPSGKFSYGYPDSLSSTLFTNLMEINQNPKKIYNPCCNDADSIMKLSLNAEKITLCEESKEEYINAICNFILHDIPLEKVYITNKSIIQEETETEPYDTIVSVPIENNRRDIINERDIRNSRFQKICSDLRIRRYTISDIYLLDMYSHLSDDGTMIISFPETVTLNSGTKKLREHLIKDENCIDTIIKIPSIYDKTNQPFIVWIISKNRKNEDVLVIDAETENFNEKDVNEIINTYKERKTIPKYSKVISLNQIKENDYALNTKKYIYKLEYTTKELSQISKEQKETNEKISKLDEKIEKKLGELEKYFS